MSQDSEQREKSTPSPEGHGGGHISPNGPVGSEVRSAKKLIIGPFLVQSTLSGSFGPNFGFWALKENLVGVGSFKACCGKRYVAVIIVLVRGRAMQRDVARYGTK